jgi:hypothetical protein
MLLYHIKALPRYHIKVLSRYHIITSILYRFITLKCHSFNTLPIESVKVPHVLKVVTFSPRLGKWAGFFSWGDFP